MIHGHMKTAIPREYSGIPLTEELSTVNSGDSQTNTNTGYRV